MNSPVKDHAQDLINSSLALQSNPAEKSFWLEKLDSMTEEALQKLAIILEEEIQKKNAIEQERLQKEIVNNNEYLETLKKVKTILIPQILEHAERSQENPEALLEQLNNGQR
jgi:hypothetical protein